MLDTHFNLADPESWLIILIYAGFWSYSYYSLVVLLIHIRQRNNSIESEEKSLEVSS